MRRQIAALASIVLLGMAGGTWASEFADGFEAYRADAGVHGQGGWKGWDNVAAADASVSDRVAHTGRNSIEIGGDADLVHEFDLSGGKWVLTAWQYIPSGATGESYFILLNTYADGGPYDWSAQTEYDLTGGTIRSSDARETARIVYDQWVEIKFLIDLTANTFEEYYNGVQIASGEWDNDEHGTLQALDLYADGSSAVYYDDIKIESATATPPVSSGFPRPSYDSGWIPTPFGTPERFYTMSLTHGLGRQYGQLRRGSPGERLGDRGTQPGQPGTRNHLLVQLPDAAGHQRHRPVQRGRSRDERPRAHLGVRGCGADHTRDAGRAQTAVVRRQESRITTGVWFGNKPRWPRGNRRGVRQGGARQVPR